jgi:hypothetical protein
MECSASKTMTFGKYWKVEIVLKRRGVAAACWREIHHFK